jgi:hypothetical protein
VKHGLAARDQVVGDKPPMASPPDSLRTHDRAAPPMALFDEAAEPRMELVGQRVVGVIVKTPVGPEAVELVGQRLPLSAQASEGGDMFVGDLVCSQGGGQGAPVELRVGARHWHFPNVDQALDARLLKQSDEFIEAAVGMADREERQGHATSYVRLSAPPL